MYHRCFFQSLHTFSRESQIPFNKYNIDIEKNFVNIQPSFSRTTSMDSCTAKNNTKSRCFYQFELKSMTSRTPQLIKQRSGEKHIEQK